ncbi:MAG TPA: hypothetical protein VFR23_13375 [Jiangellaceae bacterium]|nr:hypothetical protein [Jiangellaceae bacterium]
MSPANRIMYGLYALCAALLVAELVIDRKAEFGGIESWFGFYAVFGFLAYCFIVNAAKLLRRLVRRPEDYYEPGDGHG